MVRILYGVAGEGMGHAIRSKVILDHLSKKNDITIVSSWRAYEFLNKNFKNVHNIYGFTIKYKDNKVKNWGTLVENAKGLGKEAFKSIKKIYYLIKENKPDVIISDFEPFTSMISKMFKIPLISIDNNHSITHLKIKVPKKYLREYVTAKLIVNSFVTRPRTCVITTFFFPKTKRKEVYLVNPILRDIILKARPSKGESIFVYQTSTSNKKLFKILQGINEKFVVYGFNQDKKVKNLVYKKFSEDELIKDLASCKAVITNGGFSLISEAVHLGKPILSMPVEKQFEQIINAIYLERLGYGEFCSNVTKEKIESFISHLKWFEQNLKRYKRDNNSRCLALVDKLIARYS